jgi:hypothetical protein
MCGGSIRKAFFFRTQYLSVYDCVAGKTPRFARQGAETWRCRTSRHRLLYGRCPRAQLLQCVASPLFTRSGSWTSCCEGTPQSTTAAVQTSTPLRGSRRGDLQSFLQGRCTSRPAEPAEGEAAPRLQNWNCLVEGTPTPETRGFLQYFLSFCPLSRP